MQFNRQRFFQAYREQVAGGTIAAVEVDHLTAILGFAETDQRLDGVRSLAAMIGTARWETRRFERMREVGPHSYFDQYEGKGGNKTPGDGFKYRGNGYCHMTFYTNHLRAQRELSETGVVVDLISTPDLLWQNYEANYEVMVRGHLEGWFTQFKLDQFVNADSADYRQARLVINPGELYIADGKWKATPARRKQCIDAVDTIVKWSKGCEAALRVAIEEKLTAAPAVETPTEDFEPKPLPGGSIQPQLMEAAKRYSPKLAQATAASTILSTVTAWVTSNRWIATGIIGLLLLVVAFIFRKTLKGVVRSFSGGL